MTVSIVTISLNEEQNIEACLDTASWADEIILVDSGSTDQTVDKARSRGAKTYHVPFHDFASQKNAAIERATGDWIFILDADERIPPELAQEIRQIIRSQVKDAAYAVKRETYFFGKRLKFSGSQQDFPIRLFPRGAAHLEQPVHEHMVTSLPIQHLHHPLVHYTTRSPSHFFSKLNRYISLEISALRQKGCRPAFYQAITMPLGKFFQAYLVKLGFLDGWTGLQYASFSAYYHWLKYWRYYNGNHVEVSPSKTKGFWLRPVAGRAYDQEFTSLLGSYTNESELQPVTDLWKGVQGLKILDVGCGTGRYLQLFNSSNALNGMDLSSTMLATAKEKNLQAHFVAGSADQIPFDRDTFDLVFSVRVIQHIRDQKRMIREMARVCKPGGSILLLCYNSWSLLNFYKHLRMSWIGRLLNIPFRLVLRSRSFFNPWGFDYDNYCSIFEIVRIMKSSGLKPELSWGVTSGIPWFWNDFLIGKILERLAPILIKFYCSLCLILDRTLARILPFKYFTDKVLVVGKKLQ